MADFEMKDNTFTLFRNSKKEKESQPDYQGDMMWKGEKIRISGWLNESKSGTKYIKGQAQEPWDGGNGSKPQPKRNQEDF